MTTTAKIPLVVSADLPLAAVSVQLTDSAAECALVWEPGEPVRLITAAQALAALVRGAADTPVGALAQPCPTVSAEQLADLATLARQWQPETGHYRAVVDAAGRPLGLLHACELLAVLAGELRTTQSDLDQQAILRSFYDSSPLMMGIVELLDDDIVMLSSNAATARYLRASVEQLQHQRASLFGVPPERIHASLARYRKSESLGRPVQFELQNSSGLWYSGTYTPIGHAQGRPRFSFVIEDITERKRTEEALRRSEAKNRALLEAIPDLMFQLDDEGVYIDYKASDPAQLPAPPEQLLGHKVSEVLPAQLAEQTMQALMRARETGEVQMIEYELALGGQVRQFEGRIAPSRPHGYLVLVRDISERKQFQRQLERAKEAAEAASQAKSQFLAMVSHEIRTPLNGILGLTGLLLLDNQLNDEQRDALETIRTSGETLLAIISDILDFSKVESGHFDLEEKPFDLGECVARVCDLFAPRAYEKGLRLDWQVAETVPRLVVGDATRLRQVLINLLANAVKFTPAGSVSLAVEAEPLAEGWQLQFVVADTGIGIPADRFDRLFKAFSQVDASTTRQYGGTGLGLAISKRLVEIMGGRIWCDSQPGQGSTFGFTLQLGQAAAQISGGNGSLLAAQAGEPLRILVAEDNAVNQKVMLQMLGKLGHRVDVACDGFEVIQAVHRNRYDLVLMDLQMPGMDGLEATRYIVGHQGTERPRLVAMTASALEEDRQVCLAAGMDDYLSKPIALEALQAMLNRWAPPRC